MSARSKAARLQTSDAGGAIHVPSVAPHIVEKYGSAREWKALKREQLRVAVRAVNELRMGSAFFPHLNDYAVDEITKHLDRLTVLLSRKVWGR